MPTDYPQYTYNANTEELISWIEIFIISGVICFTGALLIDLVTATNIIIFFPALTVRIPHNLREKFPFFTAVANMISNFKPDSSFFIVISLTLITFLIQILFLFLGIYLL